MSIASLNKAFSGNAGAVHFKLHIQVAVNAAKETQTGKPYREMQVVDSTGSFKLRVWQDAPAYRQCCELADGTCIEADGVWTKNDFGLDAKSWKMRVLNDEERRLLLTGSPDLVEKQESDWADIIRLLGSIENPALKRLCDLALQKYTLLYRRAAAARSNHHARRGGLVEHVAGMMRSADGVCRAYGDRVNRDLVLAGVFFHDIGKLWENQYESEGFVMPFTKFAEAFGHIAIGVELVGALWREMHEGEATEFSTEIRLALCHLILSHHGQLEFGSPVTPKCVEAVILHFVDNIDAKLEMMFAGMAQNMEVGAGVIERKRPLSENLIMFNLGC